MNDRNQLVRNIATAFGVLALLFGLMFVAEVGIGETTQIVLDPAEVDASTNTTFGGDVGFLERAAVTGLVITMIGPAGLGLYKTSRNDPQALKSIEKNSQWLVAAVGIIGFWAIVTSVIDGSYDWDANTSAMNAFNGFVAMATAIGILQFLGLKK